MKTIAVLLVGVSLAACVGAATAGFVTAGGEHDGIAPAGTPQPPGTPDLVVVSVSNSQAPWWDKGDCTAPAGVNIVVKNVGTAKAGSSITFLSVFGREESLETPALQPEEEVTLHPKIAGLRDGDTYTVVADSEGEVQESDETNNTLEAFVYYTTLPTCTPTPQPTPALTPSPTSGPPPGDASCDGVVNSIDAALVLQLGAGLVPSLACQGSADVSADGLINAIDAALILQFEARLIDCLAP